MIIVKLQGGLGNQMFQYAFGFYLASKYNTELKFDLTYLLDRSNRGKTHTNRTYDLDIFDIPCLSASLTEIRKLKKRVSFVYIDKVINKLIGLKKSYVLENNYSFSPEIFNSEDNVYLEGYWQSVKYFKPIENIIKEKFTPKRPLSIPSKALLKQIESVNSVCVNIRRGDFLINCFHPVMPPKFYLDSEKLLLERTSGLELFVFSDDLEWCQDNLKFRSPVTFVSETYNGPKYQEKFGLMSSCKHFIIPNSTFAWWAAYLCKNENKLVIAPEKWFNDPKWSTTDLLLDNWIKVNV